MPNKLKLTPAVLKKIKQLQAQLDGLHKLYGISPKGDCLWRGSLNSVDPDEIVVEADGLGGATTRQVDGNWPVDCMCVHERKFLTEKDACSFASSVTGDDAGAGDWEEAERLWDAPETTGN